MTQSRLNALLRNIAELDGRKAMREHSATMIENISGESPIWDHRDELMATANSIQETINFVSEKLADVEGTPDMGRLLGEYSTRIAEQIIFFDGLWMYNRAVDANILSIAFSRLIADPNETATIDIVCADGLKQVTAAQIQGLIHAGRVLEDAATQALDDTLAQHGIENFSDWPAAKLYYDIKFGESYEPFISGE